MKLVEMKCKNCGSMLEIEEGTKQVTCKYCHTSFMIDDEVQHVQHDNMYESGYEFEKGRMQAQSDKEIEDSINDMKPSSMHSILSMIIIIAFIAIFVSVFIVIFREVKYGIDMNKKAQEQFSSSFSTSQKIVESQIEETQNEINKRRSESEKSSFNYTFEKNSGTKRKFWINYLLDDVVTNNKTNSEQLITVVYGDINTTDPDQIIDIKHSIKENKDYEIVLDYDEDGYVNVVNIRNI